MKTILVIEDLDHGDNTTLQTCDEWGEQFTILNTFEMDDAIVRIPGEQVDLVLCEMMDNSRETVNNLARMTRAHPYVPCIAIIDKDCTTSDQLLKIGANCCLKKPIDKGDLFRWITELLEITNSGIIKGLPIHSLLQMLEGDKKTCTLQVMSRKKSGHIFLRKGKPIAAETGKLSGEDAFYSIVAWGETVVKIKYYNCQRNEDITKPLISLLMEAFRKKDERESMGEQKRAKKKVVPELKHISTSDNKYFLEVGSKIRMEFAHNDSSLTGIVAGIVPDQVIILYSHASQALADELMEVESRVTVKYLYMGRVCLFKTRLLSTISEPSTLLFFAYPEVIHYHELRRAKRTSIFIPCTFIHPDGTTFMGVVADLSKMGCLCKVKLRKDKVFNDLDVDAVTQLQCLVPGLREDEILTGLVKNIKKNRSEMNIGMEFTGLPGHVRKAIEKYLDSVETLLS